MESYCVIHFKDKPEKIKILNFLASETEADYKVTPNLKKYVAKQFNVTILENNEENMRNVSFDTATIQNVVQAIQNYHPTNSVVSPPIDTPLIEQQHSFAPIVPPSPVVEQRRVIETITIKDEVVDTVEDVAPARTNNNAFHNYIFLQPPPQNWVPNQEQIINEVPVVEDQSIEEDAPSTSRRSRGTTRRQAHAYAVAYNEARNHASAQVGRLESIRKRINDLMDEDNGNGSEDAPVAKRTRNDEQSVISGTDSLTIRCKKCGTRVYSDDSRLEHVLMHANIKKYQCMVEGCGYRYIYKDFIVNHMKHSHKTQLDCFEEIELTHEQRKIVEETMKTCFLKKRWNDAPLAEPTRNDEEAVVCESDSITNKCQKCGTKVISDAFRLEHVLMHANIKKYQCMVDGCGFKYIYKHCIVNHMKHSHENQLECFGEIELTDEQKKEVDATMKACFSGPPFVLERHENTRNNRECQECGEVMSKKQTSLWKQDHVLTHLKPKLYKCMERGCWFKGKTETAIMAHKDQKHCRRFAGFEIRRMTDAQEWDYEEMWGKCFP